MTLEELHNIGSQVAGQVISACRVKIESVQSDDNINLKLCDYSEQLFTVFDCFRKRDFSLGNEILTRLKLDTSCSVCEEIIGIVSNTAQEAESAFKTGDLAFRKAMARLYEKIDWASQAFCPDDPVDDDETEEEALPPGED